ncbi:urate oxidase [Neobacillus niacini]|uniref:factor-independent urate hydroxylase n=1 Tax=Neobacillus niacini TaxID=86668 RepID=UPI00052F8573|nr:urate oxidase [Neobacillus niacini]KGM46460.1 uricase [Neobacillus niacini]MEC1524328.1 urate oxidase [Neobacillus niacini]
MKRTMSYGKADVWVYRTYAKPLTVIRNIPESTFTGRKNILFGMNVKVAVEGEAFFSSFKNGDNTLVVATDSMKNFILKHAGDYQGATQEGFLEFVAQRFLETYSHMTGINISGEQISFEELPVPTANGSFEPSPLVFRYSLNEQAGASIEVKRENDDIITTLHLSTLKGLKLIKVKGSSFYGYVKDEYTTLPESFDRPLFIFLNIDWRYDDLEDARGNTSDGYVAAEQVRDIAYTVFHEENSPSIQNLIYRIGTRILERFPQLAEVRFESNNRTWETILDEIPASQEGKVFTEPRPPYGFQCFSMTRADLEAKEEPNK